MSTVLAGVKGGKSRRRNRRPDVLARPHGVIHPRVQKVGPERFGIVSVDCAKARSKWMLADFYGNVHVPPRMVEHNREGFQQALESLREAVSRHDIQDVLVAVERTGRYHHPVQRAFANGGFEARTVHPLTAKQFRLPADPGIKTDDNDLAAIHRAAVNGFALMDPEVDVAWRELQLLTRHRRDLVQKASMLCCQIKEHLDAAMPGFAACFPTLWEHPAALHIAWHIGGAEALEKTSTAVIGEVLRQANVGFQQRTLEKVKAWCQVAAPPDVAAEHHRKIAQALDEDRQQKEREIAALEMQIAAGLVGTAYVLLLSIPGINVVSAAEYAAEMGPMCNYANPRCITGRAGIYPSRYQSDKVDISGKLVKCGNRRLRAAILQIADNLLLCNHYFALLGAKWKAAGRDPRAIHVMVASRFCRISFHMVAGGQVFTHPGARDRSYILQKLMTFHRDHQTSALQVLPDVQRAMRWIPKDQYAYESIPIKEELEALQNKRGHRRPQTLAEILPAVLAGLGLGQVQCHESGTKDPT